MTARFTAMFICGVVLAGLLILPASSVGQSVKTTEPTRGSITGRVLNSAGEPIVGASVFAGSLGDPRRSQTVTVNDSGNFKIDGLSAGVYRLWASSPGYVPLVQSGAAAANFYHIGDTATLTLSKGAVITGKITGANGPMIGVGVFAIRVRDEEGKRLPAPAIMRERATDDRGIYRIYGLSPGTYLIMAARPRVGMIAPSAYDNDMATYFPSSARDTASEITVREGDEVSADIQYRAEPGHTISGQVAGVIDAPASFAANANVILIDVRDRMTTVSVGTSSYDNFKFALTGIPDGEYEVFAFQFSQTRDELRSKPRRIVLRGADVSGVALTVAKQAAIEGRVLLEADPKLECGKREETVAQETVVYGRRYEPDKKSEGNAAQADVSLPMLNYAALDVGDAKGAFRLRNLPPGTYRIEPRAPGDGWYLRSISTGLSIGDTVNVRAGETVSGVTVTLAEGAAVVQGSVAAPKGGRLPKSTFVYLIPAEKENATTLFRYFEARIQGDGTFSLGNIAPGEYFIVALKPDNDAGPSPSAITIRQDATLRNTVVREAEKLKQKLSVKPCERLDNFDLTFTSPTNP
jgi:carboxypeptidase family protein